MTPNNGYNLNLAKRVLAETADCQLFWLEEAFQEDPVLYEELRGWMEQERLAVLIADGEVWAPPQLMDWARQGIVDVIQYDIFSPRLQQLAAHRRATRCLGGAQRAASLWPPPG